jgi:hypothetical protein
MKKSSLAVVSIVAIVILSLLGMRMTGRFFNHQADANLPGGTSTTLVLGGDVERVEVFHFHGMHQCDSCTKVGQYAEDTVNTYFSNELASGMLIFAHVNGDLPENKELVSKYGATGSSLWIGVYDSTGFRAEQNMNVWYKINDKEGYMAYLKGIISEKLSGVS